MNTVCSAASHGESPVRGVTTGLAVNGKLAGCVSVRRLADLERAGIHESAPAHVEGRPAV